MARRERKKRRFSGKVAANARRRTKGAGSSPYLRVDVSQFREEARSRYVLDVLPYPVTSPNHPDRDDQDGVAVPGEYWYKRPYRLHRSVGSENEKIVCPGTVKKPCPICEYRGQLIKEGAHWKSPEVKELQASLRNLYAVCVKKEEGETKSAKLDTIQVWDIAEHNFQMLLYEEIEEDEDRGRFPDPQDGLQLAVRFRLETLGKAEFPQASKIEFCERDYEYDDEFLKKVPELDDCLVVLPYERIVALFYQTQGTDVYPLSVDSDKDVADAADVVEEDVEPEPEYEEDVEPEPEYEEDEEECAACEGTGENSKGRECPICDGTGVKPEIKDKPKSGPKPKPKSVPKKKEGTEFKKAGKKEKCPHGFSYGVDAEEHEECDVCDLFEKCMDVKEEIGG